MKKHDDFERCFFETALEYGIQKYGRQNKFAQAIFPEKTEDNANATLVQMKFPTKKTQKPRGVSLSDAHKMAEALGQTVSSLSLEVETKLRLGWSEEAGGQLTLLTAPEKKEAPQTRGENQDRPALPSGLERAGQGNGVDTLPGTRQPI